MLAILQPTAGSFLLGRSWQRPGRLGNHVIALQKALRERKLDTTSEKFVEACLNRSTFGREYATCRMHLAVKGRVIGLDNGELAILGEYDDAGELHIAVFKSGNVKSEIAIEHLEHLKLDIERVPVAQ